MARKPEPTTYVEDGTKLKLVLTVYFADGGVKDYHLKTMDDLWVCARNNLASRQVERIGIAKVLA